MAKHKSPDSFSSMCRFPYSALWEEIGDHWVTFEDLVLFNDQYQANAEISHLLDLELPNPGRTEFGELVAGLSLPPSEANHLVERAQLVAGWYLAPQVRKILRNDVASVSKKLKRVASLSRELYELSNRVIPRVDAIMNIVRLNDPDVFDAAGPGLLDLRRALHDLSVVADRVVRDTAPRRTGRREQYVRDTAIRLAIEAARSVNLNDLTISRGTSANPEPRLKGRAGQFLSGFFALIAPNLSDRSLIPVIERVRRKIKA